MMFDDANQPDEEFRLPDKRSGEEKIDRAAYPIIAEAIIDQVTQPHVNWVLKELGKPLRMI
jgi:hypothetical protein